MTNKEFREAAAKQTKGNIIVLLLCTLIWLVIIWAVRWLPDFLLMGVLGLDQFIWYFVLFLLAVIVAALGAISLYGMAQNQSQIFNKKNASIAASFSGFKRIGVSIGTGFLMMLYLFLWLIIPIAGLYLIFERYYAYSCSFYIIQDDSDKGPADAITESKRLMDGKKWRMFCLDVYYLFVWYILLGVITIGIAWVWGIPRHMQARFNLYKDAKKEDSLRVKGASAR